MKIIIVGNGAAGNAALEEILKDKNDYSITVITKESEPIYYRPMLSEYISVSEIPNRFYLHDKNWYAENNVDIMFSTIVTKISPENKTITISNDKELKYDKLIIASGSYNFVPPIPGHTLSNVFSLRTLNDADKIKKLAANSKKAVIIGGGLLGLEIGWQLKKLNIDITVVEMLPRLLPRQLDEEASVFFEEKVAEAGIRVLKNTETREIVGSDCAQGVMLGDESILDADMVLFSIGIRADVSLAKEADIQINRGIIVDEFMATTTADIYAAGDCAEHLGINYGIWPEAMQQGKVAGLNAIGLAESYKTVVPFNIYSGMNMKLFSIGDVGGNKDLIYDTATKKDNATFEKFFFSNENLVGGILIGNISKAPLLKKALAESMSKTDFLEKIK